MSLILPTQPTTCTTLLTAGMKCKRLQKKPFGHPFSEMLRLLLNGNEEQQVLKKMSMIFEQNRISVLKTEAILFREPKVDLFKSEFFGKNDPQILL